MTLTLPRPLLRCCKTENGRRELLICVVKTITCWGYFFCVIFMKIFMIRIDTWDINTQGEWGDIKYIINQFLDEGGM